VAACITDILKRDTKLFLEQYNEPLMNIHVIYNTSTLDRTFKLKP